MNVKKITNLSLKEIRNFLNNQGLKVKSIRGGHEKWIGKKLLRPIILQTHIDPVPPHIIKQILRHLDLTNQEFFDVLSGKILPKVSKYTNKNIVIRGTLDHNKVIDKIKKNKAIIQNHIDIDTHFVITGTDLDYQTYNDIKKYKTIRLKPIFFLKS